MPHRHASTIAALLTGWILSHSLMAQSQVVTSVTPNEFSIFGPAVTFTVSGSGFGPTDAVVLRWSIPSQQFLVMTTAFRSPTRLEGTIGEFELSHASNVNMTLGGMDIGVSPGGSQPPVGWTSVRSLLPYAEIEEVLPGSLAAGPTDRTITIRGQHFLAETEVLVNTSGGHQIVLTPTALRGRTELDVVLPAFFPSSSLALLGAPQDLDLWVDNVGGWAAGNRGGRWTPHVLRVHPGPFDAALRCVGSSGPSGLELQLRNGTPTAQFQVFVAVNRSGIAPAGWFFGIDLSLAELGFQLGRAPFAGRLDATGSSLSVLPTGACPLGLTVDMVPIEFSLASGSLSQIGAAATFSL